MKEEKGSSTAIALHNNSVMHMPDLYPDILKREPLASLEFLPVASLEHSLL